MKLLIVDTETTGLNPEQDLVIEVAAILYSVENKTVLQQISTLLPVSENNAEHLNKISVAASQLVEVDFSNILWHMGANADFIVAHNAAFDNQWFDDIRLPSFTYKDVNGSVPWICTCSDFEFPYQQRQGQSLVELAVLHDVPVVSAHRALTDCQLLASIFSNIDDLKERILLAAEPRHEYAALVSYDHRELAKINGFRWNPERKQWIKRMSKRQLENLPFEVVNTEGW